MNITLHTISTGVLFLLTIGSGVWLSNIGKPLNTAIFTLHKLIAVAAVILTVTLVRNLIKFVEINNLVLALIVISGLFILGLFISGALLSLGKSPYGIIKLIHNVTTFSAVIAIAVTIYQLIIRT